MTPPPKRFMSAVIINSRPEPPNQPLKQIGPASAPHVALFVAELRDFIFEHLDTPSLIAAGRVCRFWAAAATRLLWHAPPFAALTSLPRQHVLAYAPAIRRLRLLAHEHAGSTPPNDAPSDAGCVLKSLQLPVLRAVEMHIGALHASLRCTLDVVSRARASVTEAAIRELALELVSPFRAVQDRDPYDNSVDASLVAALRELGQLPRLAELEVDVTLRPALLRLFSNQPGRADGLDAAAGFGNESCPTSTLFGSLRRLSVRVYPAAVVPLVSSVLAAKVADLKIVVLPYWHGKVVEHLSPLRTKLQRLSIQFNWRYLLTLQDVEVIGSMMCLKELRLRGGSWWLRGFGPAIHAVDVENPNIAIASTGLGDENLASLLARLPLFEALDLHCLSKLTANAVPAIGQVCRHLKHLRLDNVPCDLRLLRRYLAVPQELEDDAGQVNATELPRPLFPELKSLFLLTTGYKKLRER
jgi:hypothetical protein